MIISLLGGFLSGGFCSGGLSGGFCPVPVKIMILKYNMNPTNMLKTFHLKQSEAQD
jgi:hypothetical protein